MQIVITRDKLLKPLQQVCGVLSSRPPTPALSNLLIKVEGQKLIMTATDLEVELSTVATLQSSDSDGIVTIPGKKFFDICRSFKNDVEITITFEENQAIVRNARSRFTLATLPANEYPNLSDWQSEVEFTTPQETLYRLIDATQFSMANQDARYFLNGMKFETEDNLLRTVATDGHRLAVCTIPLEQTLQEHSVILPRKGVLELKKLLNNSGDPAHLKIGTNNLSVSLEDINFTSKLIDGRYPDYRRVLPRNADNIMEADASTLKNAFTRAAILSNERFRGVRLNLANNQLTITASNPEHEMAEEIIDINYPHAELEIGFNVSYLIDVLNALKCENVRFRFTDSGSSCLIENSDDPSAEYVIMPMRL